MSSGFKLYLNTSGVRELLRSQEMRDYLRDFGLSIANGITYDDIYYASGVDLGTNRARVNVFNVNWQAYADNKQNNTLLKALKTKK